MSKVVEIAKCGKYVLENCGAYWAICEVSEKTPRVVYHTGSEKYIKGRWNRHYKNVMYRQCEYAPIGCMEIYFEK